MTEHCLLIVFISVSGIFLYFRATKLIYPRKIYYHYPMKIYRTNNFLYFHIATLIDLFPFRIKYLSLLFLLFRFVFLLTKVITLKIKQCNFVQLFVHIPHLILHNFVYFCINSYT